jgi:hypothetical protein
MSIIFVFVPTLGAFSRLFQLRHSDDVGHSGFGRLEVGIRNRKTGESDGGRQRQA